jgi:hypothetical protein
VEFHGMAYAYDAPADDLLNNSIFIHYDIYNRSDKTYYNTYLGSWTDFDIGYAWDDFVGSNVELGSYYGYNGTPIDGSGEPEAYGDNPPVQSVTFIAGPFMDTDGEDNPSGGCDYSINGLNFGDGIADNERFGMTRFTFHNNSSGAQGDPGAAPEYYNYLKGVWKDNTHVIFGGNGHTNSGGVGPECMFMFPDESDPCNWGTDGAMPNGGYNQGGKYWTEAEVENNPSDRRGLGVTGPFTFKPGDRQELELAFSVGQGNGGGQSSMQQLFDNLANLFQRVDAGEIIIPSSELAIDERNSDNSSMNIFPNPVKESIYVSLKSNFNASADYHIFDNLGNHMMSGSLNTNATREINVKWMMSGLYIIKIINNSSILTGKFIKM